MLLDKKAALYNGDCVQIVKQFPDNSVHFNIFSPPFANLYIYSDDLADMGNCKDKAEFLEHFDFLIPELYRITIPGRLCAVHCKQLVKYKGRDGRSGWDDFRGDIIRHFERVGWQYHSEVVIWTDPVLEMQKTKTQRLLYKQLRHDASLTGIGMPEYLVVFRKWPEDGEQCPEPIKHYRDEKEAFAAGAENLQIVDLEVWQRYASPVWFDIPRTDVLNVKIAREDKDEKHICPLQLTVIRRAIELWTNPNDIVFSPFGGIGSEPYTALQLRRRAIATELKKSYFDQMVSHCKSVVDMEQISFL